MRLFWIASKIFVLLIVTSAPGVAREAGGRASHADALQSALAGVVAIKVLGAAPVEVQNPFFNHPSVYGEIRAEPEMKPFGSVGSGVIVAAKGDKGYIITNFHVIQNAVRIGVSLHDGRGFEAQLIGRDAATDIAVLSVEARDLPSVPIAGLDERVAVGDIVFAVGNPLGLESTATMGMVSSLFRSNIDYRNFEGFIQHDAAVNPGNSGGALVNAHGRLIGINTAIKSPSGGNVGLAFAQPIGLALKIAMQLVRDGKVIRGDVGARTGDVTPGQVARMKLASNRGALVLSVAEGSTAAVAGLMPGDVIVDAELDWPRMLDEGPPANVRVPIASRRAFDTVVGIHGVGESFDVTVLRGLDRRQTKLVVGEGKRDVADQVAPTELKRLGGLTVGEIGPLHPAFGEVDGVLVVAVAPGTIAQFIGLLPGDVVAEVQKRQLRKPEDLFDLAKSGPVELKVYRDRVPVMVRIPF